MIAARGTTGPGAGSGTDDRGRGRVAFVSDFRHLVAPFATLAPVLLDPRSLWLYRLADAAAAGDDTARSGATVRVGLGPKRARVPVVVSLGVPRGREDVVVIPLTWEPAQFDRLLPALEGDLELSALGEAHSRLAITGRYRTPLAQLGLSLDRVALHRIAESSVRNFLEEVEAALVEGGAPQR